MSGVYRRAWFRPQRVLRRRTWVGTKTAVVKTFIIWIQDRF